MTDNQPGAETASPFGPRREVLIVLPGLLLAIMLAMLDQLIVSTALPRIVGDLGGVNHLSWVVTAYVLASTVTTPLYGKLGDLYGRKRWLMISIVVFLIGSALSGLSTTMAQLIAFRAIQGLGAGGLMVGAIATLGDMVSPRERGQYMGYMMAGMMLAMIAGPLAGGYITDSLSWRWVFYINMPVGGAALLYLAWRLHLPRHKIQHKIDYLGAAIMAIATTSIVLLTTWGGTQYKWGSPQILGLGTVAVVATVAFILVERRATEPVLPMHIFRNRNFSLSSVMIFMVGLGLFGAVTFLPLYQQTVQGLSATGSGVMLIPMMFGSAITSLIAGRFTTKTGRYKALPIIGSGTMAVGMFLLSGLGVHTTKLTSGLFLVVIGIGMGFLMQVTTLVVQNSVDPRDMGVASSSRTFFQQIGGSMGVAAFGALFTRRLTDSMAAQMAKAPLPPGARLSAGGGQFNPATVHSLPPAFQHIVYNAIAHAIDGVFLWVVPAALLVFLVAWFIEEVPLRGHTSRETQPAAPELVG